MNSKAPSSGRVWAAKLSKLGTTATEKDDTEVGKKHMVSTSHGHQKQKGHVSGPEGCFVERHPSGLPAGPGCFKL